MWARLVLSLFLFLWKYAWSTLIQTNHLKTWELQNITNTKYVMVAYSHVPFEGSFWGSLFWWNLAKIWLNQTACPRKLDCAQDIKSRFHNQGTKNIISFNFFIPGDTTNWVDISYLLMYVCACDMWKKKLYLFSILSFLQQK